MRFFWQWIVSEKEKKSVIPIAFWYFSLLGSLFLLIYAVLRRDIVFMVGQSTGFIPLSRSSQEMATQGRKIRLENVQVSDLLFFKTTRRNRISHVGMVVDVDGDVKFIHSSSKRGVVISSLSDAYYKKAFRMAKRVM